MGPKLTQAEGMILGTAAKMFTIAGPVIVYGVWFDLMDLSDDVAKKGCGKAVPL